MATIKVACPKCGQKVSGDETFAGAVVTCPVCSADIHFPGKSTGGQPTGILKTVDSEPGEATGKVPLPPEMEDFDEAIPQASSSADVREEIPAPKEPADIEDVEDEERAVPSPVFGAVSLVASVLGVVLCIVGGILFSPIAIIFGHVSQAKAKHSPVHPAPGQTLGAVGMLIGYVWLVITILILGVLVLFEDSIREMVQSSGV